MKRSLARAIVAVTALLIASGGVPAQSTSGLPADSADSLLSTSAPAHWKELPALARTALRAMESLGDDMPAVARAWGDPAAGVFAVVLEARARVSGKTKDRKRTAPNFQIHFRGLLQSQGATIRRWATDEDMTRVRTSGGFTAFDREGRVLLWSGFDSQGRLVALSALCFFDQRDRPRTERECAAWLESAAPTQPFSPFTAD